jgi:hypothetical protein
MAAADRAGVPLEALLRRVPEAGEARWEVGPSGDFLAEFRGRKGVGLIRPGRDAEGRWLVFHQGVELDGDCRGRLVRPGDHLKLQYATARECCGDVDQWRGYVEACRALRDLRDLEARFWTFLESSNSDQANAWTAQRRQVVIEQARAVAQRYDAFLVRHGESPLIAQYYPRLKPDLARFKEAFTGNEVRLPSYAVRVTEARVWWNKDQKLNPQLVVTCNGREVRGEPFTRDGDRNSGRIGVRGDGAFEWSPFDAIELRVVDKGFGESGLRHVVFDEFAAAAGLAEEQPLDLLAGADPALSRVQLLCEFECEGEKVEAQALLQDLGRREPRVVSYVPPELDPLNNALDFWLMHHPACSCRSAAIYEDLYESCGPYGRCPEPAAKLNYHARALTAWFRAFRFDRCAKLARLLPGDGDVTDAMKAELPPRATLASLRQLGQAAAAADGLSPDSGDFRRLARFLLDWESFLRLKSVVKDDDQREKANSRELREWLGELERRIERDRGEAEAAQGPALRPFLQGQARDVQADLQSVAALLRKK